MAANVIPIGRSCHSADPSQLIQAPQSPQERDIFKNPCRSSAKEMVRARTFPWRAIRNRGTTAREGADRLGAEFITSPACAVSQM